MKVLSPKLDIQNEIIKADFLIQLSDNEGYCYSVIEALTNNIPVIVTPVPVFKELKINEENSIILNFDCSNLDEVINKIQTKKFNFTYKAPEDN
ncbi:MAG: glycosyltransferase [Clostridiales bacterium]|nr:glycosyltransferase [Clostridiales bacterium]